MKWTRKNEAKQLPERESTAEVSQGQGLKIKGCG